jgi:hypothetical protein
MQFICSLQTEQTTIELHKLLNQQVDKEGREEVKPSNHLHKKLMCFEFPYLVQLQIFAMQLLQNRAQFTAAGVFPLDFTLLYSVR